MNSEVNTEKPVYKIWLTGWLTGKTQVAKMQVAKMVDRENAGSHLRGSRPGSHRNRLESFQNLPRSYQPKAGTHHIGKVDKSRQEADKEMPVRGELVRRPVRTESAM